MQSTAAGYYRRRPLGDLTNTYRAKEAATKAAAAQRHSVKQALYFPHPSDIKAPPYLHSSNKEN